MESERWGLTCGIYHMLAEETWKLFHPTESQFPHIKIDISASVSRSKEMLYCIVVRACTLEPDCLGLNAGTATC